MDRGKKSLEVLLILLTCFIIFPGCVMLNRGNHEDAVMNHRYGFTREVHQKYRHNADRLLKLIDQVYRHLPLGTLINNKIFVVHGGISETTDLEMLSSLRRSKVREQPERSIRQCEQGKDIILIGSWKFALSGSR